MNVVTQKLFYIFTKLLYQFNTNLAEQSVLTWRALIDPKNRGFISTGTYIKRLKMYYYFLSLLYVHILSNLRAL